MKKGKVPNKQQEFLQQQKDDKKTGQWYWELAAIPNLDASWKLLLMAIFNNVFMNGHITWKQMTFADKLGITRSTVHKAFQKMEKLGIIVPHKDNKAGGKQNKYDVRFDKLRLLQAKSKPKKNKVKKETCITEETNLYHRRNEPVSPEKQTCITDDTNNKDNKANKALIEEEASFDDAPSSGDKKPIDDQRILELAASIDID